MKTRGAAASTGFYIRDGQGRYLLDPKAAPRAWSRRRGIVYSTIRAADRAVERFFVSPVVARELLGISVVPVRH